MAEKKEVTLKVVEAQQDDAYKGIARIYGEVMRELGIRRGDIIHKMIFAIPLVIWTGYLALASLIITLSLGIAVHIFKKPVFRFHKFFAFFTVLIAIIHSILGILFYFFGIVV